MRGASGTKIKLTVLRKGEKKPFDVSLVRAVVHVATVKFHLANVYRKLGVSNRTAAVQRAPDAPVACPH